MSIPNKSIVRNSIRQPSCIIVVYCNFPLTVLGGNTNSGIAWMDPGNHSKIFPINLDSSNFTCQYGNIRFCDTFIASGDDDTPPAMINIDLIGVDKFGVDLVTIGSLVFTSVGGRSFFQYSGVDGMDNPGTVGPIFVSGFRLQTTSSDCGLDMIIGAGFPLIFTLAPGYGPFVP